MERKEPAPHESPHEAGVQEGVPKKSPEHLIETAGLFLAALRALTEHEETLRLYFPKSPFDRLIEVSGSLVDPTEGPQVAVQFFQAFAWSNKPEAPDDDRSFIEVVCDAVGEFPGLLSSELAEKVNVPPARISSALTNLKSTGWVSRSETGRWWRTGKTEGARSVRSLIQPTVLEVVAKLPNPFYAAQLGEQLGKSASSVSPILAGLRKKGLIRKLGNGAWGRVEAPRVEVPPEAEPTMTSAVDDDFIDNLLRDLK